MNFKFQQIPGASDTSHLTESFLKYDFPTFTTDLRPRRPPLSLFNFYSNSLAFSQDCFSTKALDGSTTIPPLSIAYATHGNFPHFLLVADEEGVVHVRNTQWASKRQGAVTYWKVHQNAIFSLKFVPGDANCRFVTASGDRNLALFDPRSEVVLGTFDGHFGSVKCFDFQSENGNVFASGARDGHILLWDTRSGIRDGSHYPVGYLVNAHCCAKPRQRIYQRCAFRRAPANHCVNLNKFDKEYGAGTKSENHHSITDVIFQDDHTFISAGTADASIKFWDLRKLTASKPEAVHTLQLDGPTEFGPAFTSLCLDGSKTQLFASCMDKTIYKFDAGPKKGAEPVAKYMGADICSFYIKCSLSPDEELLGCGSSEKNAFLFKVGEPEAPPVLLSGHTSEEVMSVAFCLHDPYQLATNGDDDKVIVWHAEPYMERNPQDVVGKAILDSRGLDERTPKRKSRDRTTVVTADPNTPSVSTWARHDRHSTDENDSRASPTQPSRPPQMQILRTPKRDPVQRKKRMKNLTLSPFMLRQDRTPPSG